MNKEDYVSLELAKKLQDKGYREPCFATYTMKFKDEFTLCIGTFEEIEFEYLSRIPSKGIQLQYLAPTLYDAQKWLREKHLLYIDIEAYYTYYEVDENDYRDQERLWEYSIWEDTTYDVYEKVKSKCSYDTYEEALNAGILEALKLI